MKTLRWTIGVLAVLFVILQFIRPDRPTGPTDSETSILKVFPVPQDIESTLRRSCFDCHSHATNYPWYSEIQPVGWWMQGHIDDARSELNFDTFGTYRTFRQYIKLGQIESEVREEKMPLPSYLPMHSEARLTPDDRSLLTSWAQAMRDSMSAWYPPDSLRRPRPGESTLSTP